MYAFLRKLISKSSRTLSNLSHLDAYRQELLSPIHRTILNFLAISQVYSVTNSCDFYPSLGEECQQVTCTEAGEELWYR